MRIRTRLVVALVLLFSVGLLLVAQAPALGAPSPDAIRSQGFELIGQLSIPVGSGMVVADGYAYITDGTGLRIVSLADPAHPTLTSYTQTPGEAHGLAVVGDLVYVADGFSGLRIYNVGNRARPFAVGSNTSPRDARSVTVAGGQAYVIDATGFLHIIDVHAPATPAWVHTKSVPNIHSSCLALHNNWVIVSEDPLIDRNARLLLVGVSDPHHPVAQYAWEGYQYSAVVSGDLLYVLSNKDFGVWSVHALPFMTFMAKWTDRWASMDALAVNGGMAYLGGDMLRVMDIGVPYSPRMVDSWSLGARVLAIQADGSYIYVSVEGNGFQVIHHTPSTPTPTVTASCTPTMTPTASSTPTETPTLQASETPTPTAEPTTTPTPSATPTSTSTPEPTLYRVYLAPISKD